MNILVKLANDNAKMPEKKSDLASGYDLFYSGETRSLKAGEFFVASTGVVLDMSEAYDVEAQVRPRSGLAAKHGITVLNTPGTIDNDYRGEIGVILINLSKRDYLLQAGDRIAQLVFSQLPSPINLQEVAMVSSTSRDDGGFGSTGK